MTGSQLIGLGLIGVGAYFIVCSTSKPDFFLYRLTIRHWVRMFGEDAAHRVFQIVGILFVVAGALQAMGLWGR